MQHFLPSPVAFHVFGRPIYWYAILITIAMILAVFICCKFSKKIGWSSDDIIDVALWALPSAILGARIFYVVFQWSYYSQNPGDIIKIWEGGLAIYGGIIAGFIAGFFVARHKKKNFFDLLDLTAPTIALGQAIGRWGNFFNQEAYGGIVSNSALQKFPISVYIEATGQYHYATFFYESAWCLLIFVFLMLFRKNFKHRADTVLSYFMLYALERGFVEGLRTDSLYIGSLRVSQLLSILLFVGILIFFIVRRVREGKNPPIITNKFNPAYVWPSESESAPSDDAADKAFVRHEAANGETADDAPSVGTKVLLGDLLEAIVLDENGEEEKHQKLKTLVDEPGNDGQNREHEVSDDVIEIEYEEEEVLFEGEEDDSNK